MRFADLVSPLALAARFEAVRRRSPAAGSDGLTPDGFASGLPERLARLSADLVAEAWQPARLVRLQVPKPTGGKRQLAIPTVGDRIVIEVARQALEPVVEPLLSDAAFAYRPGRSPREAVAAVARALAQGARWAAVGDIRDFFDNVPIARLADAIAALSIPPELARLVRRLLEGHAWRPGRGIAQGSALSPLASNLVLTPLDRALTERGWPLVRYSDNLCVPAPTEDSARGALGRVRRELAPLGLGLKDAKSLVVEVRDGFLWLGFWLGPGGGRVSDGALAALAGRAESAGRGLAGAELRLKLLPIVRGWAQYFDAPLPDGLRLGDHDALLRSMIAECRGEPAPGPAASPAATPVAASPDLDDAADTEPWEDEDEAAPPAAEDAAERLLAEAERLAREGQFSAAEAAWEAAQAAAQAVPPPAAPPPDPEWDEEAVDAFLGLFCAGQDSFETAVVGGEPRQYRPVVRPPTQADVRDHLAGRCSLAVRPRLADGTSTLGVLDVDGEQPSRSVAVQAYVQALLTVAESWGWRVLREETGGRGAHVWLPVEPPVRAELLAANLAALERAAGTPAAGVRVERLPAADEAVDLHEQAMALPLGHHAGTGARSRLAWAGGLEIDPDLGGIFAGRPTEAARLDRGPDGSQAQIRAPGVPLAAPASPEAASRAPDTFGRPVARVLEGCAVLRHLADKATAVGHLDHGERLSLLFTLGHLGLTGERAIHAIVGRCRNYDAQETSRQIARRTGLPIRCARLRDKHATGELADRCHCDFGDLRKRGGYPTPLLHAMRFRRAWSDVLRGRRQAEAAAERPTPGVAAVPAPAGPLPEQSLSIQAQDPSTADVATRPPAAVPVDPLAADGAELDRVGRITATPPHDWA